MESLRKSLAYQSLYQVLVVILPLVTTPYVARVLGVQNSGIYAFTNTIASYFAIFGMLGLEQYGTRCIAQARDNKDELSTVFCELLVLHVLVSLAALASYFGYCFTLANEYREIFLLQGFYVASAVFDVNWFFFGIGKFKLTVTRNTIIKILTVVATFLCVKTKSDLGVYTFILSISMLLSQIAVWPMLRKYVRLTRVTPSNMKRHWKPLLLLFVAVIAANLNRMIDKAMLGWFGRIDDLGCYDYADRIVRIPLSFIAALGTVMLSKMSNLSARHEEAQVQAQEQAILDASACLVLLASVGMGFGVAAIAPDFVPLFLGEEYGGTVVLLSILSLSIPLVGWNNYIRTQVLIPNELDAVYTRAVIAGAVVNVLVNCVLIWLFGARGAAVSTVVSYAVILVVQTAPLAREVRRGTRYAVFPLVVGTIMYGAVRLSAWAVRAFFVDAGGAAVVGVELLVGAIVFCGPSLLYFVKRG